MTDFHHPSHLLPKADDLQANPAWTTIIGALIVLALVLGAAHFADPNAVDVRQVESVEKSSVKLDGRGKWTGFM